MRWFHWLYAHIGGYFWLPCPVCGKMFGGHESHFGTPLITDEGRAMGTCSIGCSLEAERLNDSRDRFWPMRMRTSFYEATDRSEKRSERGDTGTRDE